MARCKGRRRSAPWRGATAVLLGIAVGCMDEVTDVAEPALRTGIAGEVEAPAGTAFDASRTVIAAYADRAAFDRGEPVAFTTAVGARVAANSPRDESPDASRATFALEVPPGAYFVDAWFDADADRQFGPGDAYAFYAAGGHVPAAIDVVDGRITDVTLALQAVAVQRALGKLSSAKSQWIKWSRTASTYSSRRFW
jgi:hypothetical protein